GVATVGALGGGLAASSCWVAVGLGFSIASLAFGCCYLEEFFVLFGSVGKAVALVFLSAALELLPMLLACSLLVYCFSFGFSGLLTAVFGVYTTSRGFPWNCLVAGSLGGRILLLLVVSSMAVAVGCFCFVLD
ncbi:hypothetical protein U1Q18_029913, partial [Sarracenia purpurea var. burkii]